MQGKSRRLGVLATVSLAGALAACGMGDAMVNGLGNGGNRFYSNQVLDEIVDVLGKSALVPAVTDEMLVEGYGSIRTRAAEGDPEAVLILFRLAERQREKKE